ncbi:MAG: Abi family protein [Schaedlerella sp.]|nr:Abi family protein [Schaedlerella sp.]
MEEKEFKTLDELINILVKRGMKINTPSDYDYAKHVLEKQGYYNLVNGYNKLFLSNQQISNDPDLIYRPGTTMHEIHALYQFDRVIRNIFFR